MAALAVNPYFAWTAAPFVSRIVEAILAHALGSLSEGAVLGAFFVNTAIRKPDQALDYIQAIEQRKSVDMMASAEEYRAAEEREREAFANFVRLTR